jgi:transcriptional regulator with XRE-family HTH domain
MKLGECRLPELLARRKLTQSEFARRLGVSRQYINKVIQGEKKLSLEQAINAAYILNCDVTDLYHIRQSVE